MTALEFLAVLFLIALALSLAMSVAWLAEQRTGNAGWVDVMWTFGLGGIGAASALVPLSSSVNPLRQWLVASVVLFWSLRLGTHIARRSARRADDPRYAKLRERWGERQSLQMWLLLQKQALVSIPMVLAIFLAAHHPAVALRLQDFVALLIVIFAIGGESLADHQLEEFQRRSGEKHAVCDAGLWRWSRHPNYFFEWAGWLAYPVVAIDLSGAEPLGWLSLAAPACMYWLLVYVSGIPPLEEHMLKARGDAFRAYQAKTSAFFPWPPRENQAVHP